MYLGSLECLFTRTPDEMWDFIEYLARETWEHENAGGIFSHSIPDRYVMSATLWMRVSLGIYFISTFILSMLMFHVIILFI